jgi:glyoxylase I family protein
MTTPVIHHVGLSVRDIEASTDWYVRVLGLAVVAEIPEPAPMVILMSDRGQAIDLREDPAVEPHPFSQAHAGLDHVGFVVADRAELQMWEQRLAEHGVTRSPVVPSPFGEHLNFRDPDGIPLEFFLPATAVAATADATPDLVEV